MTFRTDDAPANAAAPKSSLSHFPVKLQLLNPAAPFLKGADLLLMADCCALCYPALHQNLLRGKAVAMGCPKLDDLRAHVDKLTQIVAHSGIRSLTVVHMEVPCCSGFVRAVYNLCGVNIPRTSREQYRVGDRVMQVRNDYDRDVYNGDLGFITAIISDTGVSHDRISRIS